MGMPSSSSPPTIRILQGISEIHCDPDDFVQSPDGDDACHDSPDMRQPDPTALSAGSRSTTPGPSPNSPRLRIAIDLATPLHSPEPTTTFADATLLSPPIDIATPQPTQPQLQTNARKGKHVRRPSSAPPSTTTFPKDQVQRDRTSPVPPSPTLARRNSAIIPRVQTIGTSLGGELLPPPPPLCVPSDHFLAKYPSIRGNIGVLFSLDAPYPPRAESASSSFLLNTPSQLVYKNPPHLATMQRRKTLIVPMGSVLLASAPAFGMPPYPLMLDQRRSINARQFGVTTASFNWWPYPVWGATTTPVAPAPAMITDAAPVLSSLIVYSTDTINPIPGLPVPLTAGVGVATLAVISTSTDPTPSTTADPATSTSNVITTPLSANTSVISTATPSPAFSSSSAPTIISITAIPPASSDPAHPAQVNAAVTSGWKPVYTIVVIVGIGVILGVILTMCWVRWRRRRDDTLGGPQYAPAEGDDHDADLEHGVDEARIGRDGEEREKLYDEGADQQDRARDGSVGSKASFTGRWLAGTISSFKQARRGYVEHRDDLDEVSWGGDYRGTASAAPNGSSIGGDFASSTSLEALGTLSRGRTASTMRKTSSSRRAHARQLSDVFLDAPVAKPARSYQSRTGEDVLSDMDERSTDGFRMMKEDPETGALLSRTSTTVTRAAPAEPGDDVVTGGAGLGWNLVNWASGRGEQEDKFSPLPVRKARSRERDAVLSRESTVVSRYSEATQGSGNEPQAAGAHSDKTPTNSPSKKQRRAPAPAKRPTGLSRVDSTVLPLSPRQISSPQMEDALSFGGHGPVSPSKHRKVTPAPAPTKPKPKGNRLHSPKTPSLPMPASPDFHARLTKPSRSGIQLKSVAARRDEDDDACSTTSSVQRKVVHEKVQAILGKSWSTRAIPLSPTMYGAHPEAQSRPAMVREASSSQASDASGENEQLAGLGIEQRLEAMEKRQKRAGA
ncbi:hypothetical protein PUNSTDRAFT_145106 [Punctularia strigosozonata HHB-11173 SS5]|uniref:uncharacterized protein n=1 Tax=Punctularia strigosozonata (strain HHB-11173) TaxID=741275 RepID=UPI0004416640|nr:uncharacterized protein PUNSTDRAFT_145106 [Punctularia strigosozonata HHB-11173 SS5]EIN06532.1 hypothetical protein PUNSTDRAFT_145106 [Punctularia strigosozonata HHB-11173 SS5]